MEDQTKNLKDYKYQSFSSQQKTQRNSQSSESAQNQTYFEELQCYETCCYTGIGDPIFLVNKNWQNSIFALILANAILLIVMFVFLENEINKKKNDIDQKTKYILLMNALVFALLNLTYFLTVFLNPGIRNLRKISEEQYEKYEKFFCVRCDGYKTGRMTHCQKCKVCIQKKDHHCSFFSKCIGGCQKYAFYGFILTVIAEFISSIITVISMI